MINIEKFANAIGSLAPAILGSLFVMGYVYDLAFSYGLGRNVLVGNQISDYLTMAVRWGFVVLMGVGVFYFVPVELKEDASANVGGKKRYLTFVYRYIPLAVYGLLLVWLLVGFFNSNSIGIFGVAIFVVLFWAAVNRGYVFDYSVEFTVFCFLALTMALIVSYAGYAEGKSAIGHARSQGSCEVRIDGGDVKQGWLVKSNSSLFFFVNNDNDLFMVATDKMVSYTCKHLAK